MRIAIVTGTFHPETGGPPTYLYRLAAELVAHGHRVRVATFGEAQRPEPYPYPVVRVSRRQPIPLRLARLTEVVLRDGRGADLIFANDYGLPPMLANLVLRRPLVMKIVSDFAWEFGVRHGLVPPDTTIEAFQRRRLPARLELVRQLQRQYARRADAVIVPSAYLARIIAGWGVDLARLHVIYNAVESRPAGEPRQQVRARLGLPNQAPLVVTVARLTPWKGVDTLLQALARLRAGGQAPCLAVVGDGEVRPALERLAAALGLTGQVIFVGAVPQEQVSAYLHAADVFALASTYEGFSHVLLEALAAEAPVVVTAVGGNPEVIRSGDTGLLVPPSDPEALAAALRRLLEEPELRARLVAGGRETLRSLTWDGLYQRTEAVFREVAGRRARGLAA